MVHFVLTVLFVIVLASDRVILSGNVVFSILVLSTQKVLQFFSKDFHFSEKLFLKVKALKTFKILKRRAIFEIPSTAFLEEAVLFLVALK